MTNETTKNEKPKVDVYMLDSHVYTCWRGPITVSSETHPELEGMSEEEIKKYVTENASEMASTSEYYDNLEEELLGADYNSDKITGERYEIEF